LVFRALIVHGSVTRAGQEIGLSQPAVSNALARLRTYFEDPLFLRAQDGMKPTTRAMELSGPILDTLDRIETTLMRAKSFDPSMINRHFRLALVDYAGLALTSRIMEVLSREAPRLELSVTQHDDETSLTKLHRAEIDLAVGVFSRLPANWPHSNLMLEQSVVAVRQGHPRIDRTPTLDMFVNERHVRVSPFGAIERSLSTSGLLRRFAASADLLAVPFILSRTDLIAILPLGVAKAFRQICNLQWFHMPIPLPPYFITLIRRPRSAKDQSLIWLSRCIETVAKEVKREFDLGPTEASESV